VGNSAGLDEDGAICSLESGDLGSTELGHPLGGLVGGAHDEVVIDLDLKAVVGSGNDSLENAGVLGVRVDGLQEKG